MKRLYDYISRKIKESLKMNKLYVLQYDDDAFNGEIFTDKDKAYKYIRDKHRPYLLCIDVHEYDNKIGGYKKSYTLYYLDKSDFRECVRHFWDDFEDKTFISSEDFHNVLSKM